MKQSISYWQVAGFLFTSILGTFLHFLFDLSGQSVIAAIFSAVNESIWEHMKLIYYPMLLFALIEFQFWGKDHKQFWCIGRLAKYCHLFPFGWCCILGGKQTVSKRKRLLPVLARIFHPNLHDWCCFHSLNIHHPRNPFLQGSRDRELRFSKMTANALMPK